MARVVEAVQIFKKVEDVTAAKDDPSPVYLMDELAEMARGSAESSEKIADRIAKRLQNKSPVVKFKALRFIRHLINKGCGQFQRSMQRHASLVREHMHFKGELDPFKGDTPNQRVRDAAKEAAESLFNTVMSQPVTNLGSRIQGFGSSAAPPPSSNNSSSGPASSANVSGSRMVGFGSSNTPGPNVALSGNGGSGSGGSSFSQIQGVNRPLTGSYGNATASAGSTGTNSAGGSGSGGAYTAPTVVATEVLGSEVQLVDSICTPGGLRLAPDAEDLRRFVEAAGNLDGLKLATSLRDKMDASGPWQQQLRALYALEAVLLQGATQACGEIAVMFQSDAGPIQAATGHTQAAVRERASRVLKLLLGQDAPAAATPAVTMQEAPAVSAPREVTADLLGGLDMLGSPVQSILSSHRQQTQQQRQPQQAVATTSGADDIFSGLALRSGTGISPQQAWQASAGPSAQPGQPRPQQQLQVGAAASAAGQVTDPFDIMQPSTAPPPQVAYRQQHQPPQWQYPGSQQPWPPGQQPFVSQPTSQQAYGTHVVVGSGLGMGHGHMMGTLMRTGASEQHITDMRKAAGEPPQASTGRPPLDDLFANVSLSGNPTGGRPGQAVVADSMRADNSGSNARGGVGHAYGGGGVGGGFPDYGNQAGAFRPGASPSPMSVPSNSGVTAAMATLPGSSQLPARQGMAGMGGNALSYPSVQQQQLVQQPIASMNPLTAGGGIDLLGVGPSVSGTTIVPGTGGYGTATGGLGMGMYPGNSGTGGFGTGVGLSHGAGGGSAGGEMMVGPGGQVRYVGSSVQPYSANAPPISNTGSANGQVQQHSWQPPYVSGGFNTQQSLQDQRGGAAFDFVREQFK